MMHEREKSDPAIVAMKPANNAERSAAEPVEPRAGAEGKCGPAQHGPGSVPAKRVTGAGAHTASSPSTPEVGAVCGKAARTDLCGGRSAMSVPTAIAPLAMTARRDSKHAFATSRRDAPEALLESSAQRGRGECRMPVAPAASCALGSGRTHTSNNEYTGITRHSRTQWF